jgi:hypothetical protein
MEEEVLEETVMLTNKRKVKVKVKVKVKMLSQRLIKHNSMKAYGGTNL